MANPTSTSFDDGRRAFLATHAEQCAVIYRQVRAAQRKQREAARALKATAPGRVPRTPKEPTAFALHLRAVRALSPSRRDDYRVLIKANVPKDEALQSVLRGRP